MTERDDRELPEPAGEAVTPAAPPGAEARGGKAAREARLAAALRANLRRRKAAGRPGEGGG